MFRTSLKKTLWVAPRRWPLCSRTYATTYQHHNLDSNIRASQSTAPTEDAPSSAALRRRLDVNLNGKIHELDSFILRDSCQCSACIDPSTTQRCFDTAEISAEIQAKDIDVNVDGSFTCSWTDDIPGFELHRSYFPAGFLSRKNIAATEKDIREKYPRILWQGSGLDAVKHNLTVNYADYMADERTLHHIIQRLSQYGIAFVSDVPSTTDAVASIAERIGPLKNTIYGSTWDVRSLTSAKNVADTSGNLGFHMDLLYYKEPPKLQILHYLKQSHLGGASLFSDSFKAVSTIVRKYFDPLDPTSKSKVERQIAIAALTQSLQPFHYKNNGRWLEYEHPTIVHDMAMPKLNNYRKAHTEFQNVEKFENALQAVRWSPPFRAPMFRKQNKNRVPRLDYWIRGAKMLKEEFEQEESIFETRMEEGTCVIFDNWRILHGRRAFIGGERWLRGAYIDNDTFRQRVLKLVDVDT